MTLIRSRFVKMDLNPYIEEILAWAQTHIGLPYYPNQDRLYRIAKQLKMKPAAQDKVKILRLHVDKQPDFINPFTYVTDDGEIRFVVLDTPGARAQTYPAHIAARIDWIKPEDFKRWEYKQVLGGRLGVYGSLDDVLRGLEFDYRNMHRITFHAVSVDTHGIDSVFDPIHYVATRNERYNGPLTQYDVVRGKHPQEFTIMGPNDVYHPVHNPGGLWRPVDDVDWTYEYVTKLHENQFPLVIWPLHCTRMTYGAMTDPFVWESILIHAFARYVTPIIFQKGISGKTEFYGIFGPLVIVAGDEHAQINLVGLELYEQFDLIIIDGEAFSHCVLKTVMQMVEYIGKHDPEQIKKLIVIVDGSSCIAGTEDATMQAYEELKRQGLRMMTYAEAEELMDSMGL